MPAVPSLIPQRYDPHIPVDALTEHPANPNEGDEGAVCESLDAHGFYGAVLVQESTGIVFAGNTRLRSARSKGMTGIPGFWCDVDDDTRDRILSVDNEATRKGRNDEAKLVALLTGLAQQPRGLEGTGFDGDDLDALIAGLAFEGGGGGGPEPEARPSLADRFLIPPFDVLDSRQGWWRERKRQWLSLGIRSEEGRRRDGDGKDGAALTFEGWARRDPQYYAKKRAAERQAGRELAVPEFEAEFYQPPENGLAGGTSIFDPVLCELAYRWFCPPGGAVIDPFAGGSVRGLVAAILGRRYLGNDLSEIQVKANREQVAEFGARGLVGVTGVGREPVGPADLTPVERHGGIWVKRDDAFTRHGSAGGKVRSCLALASRPGVTGLVTAGSRQSPQVNIVAGIAASLGLPCRVHVPAAKDDLTPELAAARSAGAEIIEHRPGYNTVIISRARKDAAARGWANIPFGMECDEAVEQTAGQVANIPDDVTRIVIPVGSGMSLAGVLAGLRQARRMIPVTGVVVGSEPSGRLDRYAPGWRDQVTLIPSKLDYHQHAPHTDLDGVPLDPVYEAKCLPFLQDGDLLWVVGCRQTVCADTARPVPEWSAGDSAEWVHTLESESADLIFTCPPYYDLEVYGDDPADLSAMSVEAFDATYTKILIGAARALRPDRFAVIITGDARNKHGHLRDLRGATIRAAAEAGLAYYSGAILITPYGPLPTVAGRAFTGTRVLSRTHQDVLVFVKGDRKKATVACGDVELYLPDEISGTFGEEGAEDA